MTDCYVFLGEEVGNADIWHTTRREVVIIIEEYIIYTVTMIDPILHSMERLNTIANNVV